MIDENPARNNKSLRQVVRYALVGVASNAGGYAVYLLLTSLGTAPKLTMTLLYGVGATIGFLGNRNLTFAHKGSLLRSVILFVVAHLVGYFLNLALLVVLVDRFGYPHQWVQALAILIVAAYLFVAFKFVIFRTQPALTRTNHETLPEM